MSDDKDRVIKIRATTYRRLYGLVERIRQDGWGKTGSSRRDEVTYGTVVDQALILLGEKMGNGKRNA